MKKTYISPTITVICVESSELMSVSGWTPNGDKEHDGFDIVEEDETTGGYFDDDDF